MYNAMLFKVFIKLVTTAARILPHAAYTLIFIRNLSQTPILFLTFPRFSVLKVSEEFLNGVLNCNLQSILIRQ